MSPRAATLVSFVSTVALYVIFWLAGEFGSPALSAVRNESLLKLALWVVPSIVIVGFMWRMPPAEALRELGLAKNPLTAVAIGLLTLIPLVAVWLQVPLSTASAGAIFGTALVGPFAEEVLFRGLLFRQWIRGGRRRPAWAIAISAVIFGAAHLTSFADDISYLLTSRYPVNWVPYVEGMFNEFGLMTLGGLLLAWIVYRWDSLWPAIAVHSALNLSWLLTQDIPRITSFTTTMMRLASITIAVYVTWRATRGKRTAPRALVSAAGVRST